MLVDYSVLDASSAWVLTQNYNRGAPYTGVIKHTSTGPAGLVAIPGALPAEFALIHFFNTTTGIALSYPASGSTNWGVYRTTNGGAGWSAVSAAISFPLTYSFAKEGKGNSLWISPATGNMVYTSDGGLTWASSDTGLASGSRVVFRDSLYGLAYGGGGQANRRQLARTADGGRTWSPIATPWPADVTTIIAQPVAGPGTASMYIGAGANRLSSSNYDGVLATSRDDGATWQTRLTDNITYDRLATNPAGQLWAATFEPAYTDMLLRYAGAPLAAREAHGEREAAYPNPTTGLLNLAVKRGETVRVYNSTGQLCQYPNTVSQLDLSAFPAGMYLVVIAKQSGISYTQRVAVIH
ncbi:MAG: T9SS type A sorting domain-containing protein [Bacteroidota bacterium]|nr:T9SS type A sorting domain-containing protein [Bacteroidota bacterium]